MRSLQPVIGSNSRRKPALIMARLQLTAQLLIKAGRSASMCCVAYSSHHFHAHAIRAGYFAAGICSVLSPNMC